jgi:hypothetical protein
LAGNTFARQPAEAARTEGRRTVIDAKSAIVAYEIDSLSKLREYLFRLHRKARTACAGAGLGHDTAIWHDTLSLTYSLLLCFGVTVTPSPWYEKLPPADKIQCIINQLSQTERSENSILLRTASRSTDQPTQRPERQPAQPESPQATGSKGEPFTSTAQNLAVDSGDRSTNSEKARTVSEPTAEIVSMTPTDMTNSFILKPFVTVKEVAEFYQRSENSVRSFLKRLAKADSKCVERLTTRKGSHGETVRYITAFIIGPCNEKWGNPGTVADTQVSG